jgi:signal transduction histidine kinase
MGSVEKDYTEIDAPVNVLIVEDDPGDIKLVRRLLLESAHQYRVETVGEMSAAIEHLQNGSAFDVVLLDMGLPDSNGTDTVIKVHNECPDIPIVVLTGLDDEDTGIGAVRIGAQDYLVKGSVTAGLLAKAIRYAVERKRMEIEKRVLEQKAQMVCRLGTVGQLALGAAHEIDNPLTSVIGFSELLQQEDVPEHVKDYLKFICDGARRVASIIDRLRTFARYHKLELTYLSINDILTDTLGMINHQLKTNNIRVSIQLAPDLPWTMADAGQLQQVFLNIILNAETEMLSANNKGTLSIKTEVLGDAIRISFEDDGPGIPKENLEKIFDPFFTTREVGEGTGLGLSICHGIVTEHGGIICTESELGKGATFFVELPVAAEARGR